MRRMTKAIAVAGAVAAALVATSCAAEIPEPVASPVPSEAPPVLDDSRIVRILADIDAVIEEADAAQDVEVLDDRLAWPALEMRAAEYRLSQASDGERTPTPLTTDRQVEVVGATDQWPRDVLVVTHVPDGANLPLLLALRQEDPRSPYTMWAWTRLLPGSQTPRTAAALLGSQQLAADAEGLLLSPADALAAYADVLGDPDGEHAELFAQDVFAEEYRSALNALGVEGASEATRSDEPNLETLAALSTDDGGAIVVGVIESTLTIRKTAEGAWVEAGGAIADLMESPEIEGAAHVDYLVTLVLVVPPEGSEELITVIGAEEIILDVRLEAPAEDEDTEG